MPARSRVISAALAAAIVVGGAVLALSLRGPEDPNRPLHVDESSLEVPELADREVAAAALEAVRHVLAGGEARVGELARYDGRRVIACAYQLQPRPICAAGSGDDLGGAVSAAAQGLAASEQDWERAILKLDFVVSEEAARWPAAGFRHGVGVHGLLVAGDGEETFLTPSELLEIGVWTVDNEGRGELDEARLRAALVGRNPAVGALEEAFPFTRFRTISWVEGAPGGDPVRTYRTHAFDPPPLDPDVLLERAFWAADHLAATTDPTGRIRYLYDPAEDRVRPGYNLLRHAGSTWSLIQAWSRTGNDAWLRASEAAIGHLLRNSRVQLRYGPYGGGETRWVRETSRIKLGGSGLGLLMLAEHVAATGDDAHLEEARQFARYIVSAQLESGEFVCFGNVDPNRPPHDDTSAYYPGEAIVGLMRLYSVDPDPLWLDTARRGAAWLIEVRDAGKGPRQLANDHWLMIGLSRLYAVTGEELWLRHSLALAEAVEVQQRRHVDHVRYHRDYAGGYYEPPRSTPAATRGEGLVAVLDTCALSGTDCSDIRRVLEDTVRHELLTQYTPETLWWLRAPERAFGAFFGGLVDVTIRNDYVQHNLSSVLGLERHLRAEKGVRLPGEPRWTPADQRGFAGLDEDAIDALRADALRLRGPSHWDRAVEERKIATDGEDAVEGELRRGAGLSSPETKRQRRE